MFDILSLLESLDRITDSTILGTKEVFLITYWHQIRVYFGLVHISLMQTLIRLPVLASASGSIRWQIW